MILDEILEAKRDEVAAARRRRPIEELRARPLYEEPRRGFAAALAREGAGRAIIAEIKKASPSRGVIRADFDPVTHARQYEDAGARCISVLTDTPYFQGSLSDLEAVRAVTTIPLLRKDFTIDEYQVVEARAHGADCILLIVAALEQDVLVSLLHSAGREGLDVLVEVHDETEMRRAVDAGAMLLGINNRNLRTFDTSLNVTRQLIPVAPEEVTLVSESGFRHPHELGQMEQLGVNAFLIGENLIKEPEPGRALRWFLTGKDAAEP
ncbi:MAG TPA: indole-3-glycerol phosphate synthase TrpC [Candidatus Limnocylindrales bacterium]|nr:indole-3-glycerol phosphate synthase TrpC [Candidatus Limnocylindrales bacterium]